MSLFPFIFTLVTTTAPNSDPSQAESTAPTAEPPSPSAVTETKQKPKLRASFATDLSPWFFPGYSAIGMLDIGDRFRTSLEIWGMKLPSFINDFASENRDEQWQRRVRVAVALYGDFHFGKIGRGRPWHTGLGINVMNSRVEREKLKGHADFWTLELLPRIGYRWFPFAHKKHGQGFFINPWMGIGVLTNLNKPDPIGGERYVQAPLWFLGTVHTGWRF